MLLIILYKELLLLQALCRPTLKIFNRKIKKESNILYSFSFNDFEVKGVGQITQ